MSRGGPVKRTHTVSVRLTPAEAEVWRAARDRAGRRELGAWVRDVVSDALSAPARGAGEGPGSAAAGVPARLVPGGPRVVPEVNQEAYRQLAGVANNLNQIARGLNAAGHVAPGALAAALVEVQQAARAVQGRPPGRQTRGGGSDGD